MKSHLIFEILIKKISYPTNKKFNYQHKSVLPFIFVSCLQTIKNQDIISLLITILFIPILFFVFSFSSILFYLIFFLLNLDSMCVWGGKENVPSQNPIFYITYQAEMGHATYAHKNMMIQEACNIFPDKFCSGHSFWTKSFTYPSNLCSPK